MSDWSSARVRRPGWWCGGRSADVDLNVLRAGLERGFVSITEFNGQRRLRSVSANPMADPELVVGEVLRAAKRSGRTRSS
jgi:hypothetical protein